VNGAEALLQTLVDAGIEVCFANPGTSEMQLVAAIGRTDAMRPVLCLFEGVVSGAADGYARMAEKPAATLLHLGSGFSNSLANMHNARRAGSPVVNIVGDHASYHLQYDAPLTSDLPGIAAWGSHWTEVASSPEELSAAGARAVQAALDGGGRIATLVAPADHAWSEAGSAAPALPAPERPTVPREQIDEAAQRLTNGARTCLFLGDRALRAENLARLGAIAERTGATLMCATFPTRLQRGAGRVPVQRLPYFAEQAAEVLAEFDQLILLGAAAPVSFFAYPGKASWLAPEQCDLLTLAEARHDIDAAIGALGDALGAHDTPQQLTERVSHEVPSEALNPLNLGQILGNELPEHAIVCDEGATGGLAAYLCSENAAPHDWLTLTGGAIGQGLPLALGAALACPDRKVIALEADGSAMYTLQALWSMGREQADVTTIILNNRSYAILNIELDRVGAGEPNPKTLSMLDLSNPDLDFASLARGMGIRATQARSSDEFREQLRDALVTPGPCLIEAIVA
jgi:acetolactate synthase-1/2/3 large subunit